jgi:hypothetical protein
VFNINSFVEALRDDMEHLDAGFLRGMFCNLENGGDMFL